MYETACALAESKSLADAAPRMLRAICQTLDWEFGALLGYRPRSRPVSERVATWHSPSLQVDEFDAVTRAHDVPAGRRPAGTRLVEPPTRLDSRRRAR